MATVKFINGKNNSYAGMKKALYYIMNPLKTNDSLIGGQHCNPDMAYHEYIFTKQKYRKESGRQFIHFVQSFSPFDAVTPEMAYEIAEKLLQHEQFKGFQITYAVHTDRAHIHTHFVINSVNKESGIKWHKSKEDLREMQDYSDELCREYNLMIVDRDERKNRRNPRQGHYRAEKNGTSWKREIYLAAQKCKFHSTSREDFINNMKRFGINVRWEDERKYITFTNQDGKVCRNRKLYPPEHFTKEALLEQFSLNQERERGREGRNVLQNNLELILQTIRDLEETDLQGSNRFPLQQLEGQALKDILEEQKKGQGLDWEAEQ